MSSSWEYGGWAVERVHDICVAAYILSAMFAHPRWLTMHPIILMIMVLNWFDPSGQCCITKFARYLNSNDSDAEKWKYSKVSVQKSAQYQSTAADTVQTDPNQPIVFQNPIQNLFRGETDEEKLANKSAFFSLYFMTAWAFLAWYRVCYYYNLPFLDDSPARYFVAAYFFSWLFVSLFL